MSSYAESVLSTSTRPKSPLLPQPLILKTKVTSVLRWPRKQIYILVLGSTGSGKSTFINLVSQSNLRVSDHLESCTQEVEPSSSFELSGCSITLIDTPGFDDTERSDIEIAKVIAAFLEAHYLRGICLHGVLYFHRITDSRLGGVSRRSLRLFEGLCGDDYLKNVIVVTNMWNRVSQKEGESRELELKNDKRFFKHAGDQEARFGRHDNTLESARKIIRMIIPNQPMPLAIQRQLVDEAKPFFCTSVGVEIDRDLQDRIRKQWEEMSELETEIAEAEHEQNKKTVVELTAEREKTKMHLDRYKKEKENITPDFDEHRQRAMNAYGFGVMGLLSIFLRRGLLYIRRILGRLSHYD